VRNEPCVIHRFFRRLAVLRNHLSHGHDAKLDDDLMLSLVNLVDSREELREFADGVMYGDTIVHLFRATLYWAHLYADATAGIADVAVIGFKRPKALPPPSVPPPREPPGPRTSCARRFTASHGEFVAL
jgi:hypothetical protein